MAAPPGRIEKLATWLNERWERLPPRRQKAFLIFLFVLNLLATAYCGRVGWTQGANALIIHAVWLQISVRPCLYVVLLINAMFISTVSEPIKARMSRIMARLRRLMAPVGRRFRPRISPLTQAHGYYTLGRYAKARVLIEAILAQEPDNTTAQEMLLLLDKQPTSLPREPAPKRDIAEELISGDFPTVALNVSVAVICCLLTIGFVYYVRIALLQGWNTTIWIGLNRDGSVSRTLVWEAIIAFFLVLTPSALYLNSEWHVINLEPLWTSGEKLCRAMFNWVKFHLSGTHSSANPMDRSTPSRSSEPKGSPASRPSSTTRTRRRR